MRAKNSEPISVSNIFAGKSQRLDLTEEFLIEILNFMIRWHAADNIEMGTGKAIRGAFNLTTGVTSGWSCFLSGSHHRTKTELCARAPLSNWTLLNWTILKLNSTHKHHLAETKLCWTLLNILAPLDWNWTHSQYLLLIWGCIATLLTIINRNVLSIDCHAHMAGILQMWYCFVELRFTLD